MMRALELTRYPLWDDGDGNVYADKDDRRHPTRVDFEVLRKRLNDAELAAEFWHAAQVATYARARIDWGLDNWAGISADRAEDIEHILHRFAEHPHFDEVPQ